MQQARHPNHTTPLTILKESKEAKEAVLNWSTPQESGKVQPRRRSSSHPHLFLKGPAGDGKVCVK
jgi:hypothetical protein